MAFLDENYLLENNSAREIYSHVKGFPIVDAHNHGDVKEIVENKGWEDIWEVEAATDHYVWELMRRRGIPEAKITGEGVSNKEKWFALASIFPEIAGNPTYEWIHLDLKHRFGIELQISEHTAEVIWEKTSNMLQKEEMKPQYLLKDMNVEIMCTTDNPDSDLEYHKQAKNKIDDLTILPTWRPDKAMNIGKKGWVEFIQSFGEQMNTNISKFDGFLTALQKSHDHFDEMGCVASDHGVEEPLSNQVEKSRVEDIYENKLAGKELTQQDIDDFKSYMLIQFGKMNEEKGWVTQLHIGAVRDYRDKLYQELGADSGGDVATNNIEVVKNLRYFFNEFDQSLKIVVYCLDTVILQALTTIARAFPNVNLGAPWWFNDSPYGMEKQLRYIATVDLLRNHVGMVTDSRKLISYGSRTEVFRRTASNVLGDMVKKGQIPYKIAFDLAESICYYRPLNFFFK